MITIMITYVIFIISIIAFYITHLKIIEKMKAKRDYDPLKVLNVVFILLGGFSFFITLLIVTGQ